MEKIFTVGQTAKIVNMTAETLRHYDRIGLIKPYKIDEWTNYRYYSNHEIVQLNTVQALLCMRLSLKKIKKILESNNFIEIINLLKQAEKSADDEICKINKAKKKIASAYRFYQNKLDNKSNTEGIFIKTLPQRVLIISDKLQFPSLDNLWNYHRSFYNQIGSTLKNDFTFEDLAGIYEDDKICRLFTVCKKYLEIDGIIKIPEGKYLCANCTEENRKKVLNDVLQEAQTKYCVVPKFKIQLVILSGILQWNYQIQVYLGKKLTKI